MKRFKHTFWRFREYEGTAFSEYLNDMAGKGWCLERISPIGTLVFEEKKQGVGHFCATVVPGETEFSEEESEEKRKFCALCEEAGWETIYSGELWQIFYAKDGEVLPIETDPGLRLQAMKKSIFSVWRLLGLILVSAVLLFAIGRFYYLMSMGEPDILSKLIPLVFAQCSILYGPIDSLIWYRHAERELSDGRPLPVTDMETIRRRTWSEVVLLLFIFALGFRGGIAVSLLFAYLMLGSYRSIVSYTINQKKAQGNDRIWAMVQFVFLYIVLFLGLLALAYNLVTLSF